MPVPRLAVAVSVVVLAILIVQPLCGQNVFPPTALGGGGIQQLVPVSVAAGGTLSSIDVVTQGAPNLDFQPAAGGTCAIGSSYIAGDTCTVNVTFLPLYPGLRRGAVLLKDSTGTILATTYVGAVGNGSWLVFNPGVQETVGVNLVAPFDVEVDSAGNAFIGDITQQKVFKVLADGSAQTEVVANALGRGIAIDGAGNLYANNAVGQTLKIPVDGSASSIIGTDLDGSEGLAVDGLGNVYIAQTSSNWIFKVPADGGPQSKVQFFFANPTSIDIDAVGNLFVSEKAISSVREIAPNGAFLRQVFQIYLARSVVVDPAGTAYISGDGEGSVLRVDAGGNSVVVGPPMQGPGLALDVLGNLYFADGGAGVLRKFDRQVQSFSYGPLLVGELSATQTATIENVGTQPLHFYSISAGSNALLDPAATTCSTSAEVVPGAMCTIGIKFQSNTAGNAVPGSVELVTDSGGGSSQTITLTGVVNYPPPTLVFSAAPPPYLRGGGNAGHVEVSEDDPSGNLPAVPVTLTVTSPTGYSQTYGPVTTTGGIAGFDLSSALLSAPGVYTYTATSPGLFSGSAKEIVLASAEFGGVPVGTSNAILPIPVSVRTAGVLSKIDVVTEGAPDLDFQWAPGGTCATGSSYASGDHCTVNVAFTPLRPGVRKGAVLLKDTAGLVLATSYVGGAGEGSWLVFNPGSAETIGTELFLPSSLSVDASGNVFIGDSGHSRIVKVPADGGAQTVLLPYAPSRGIAMDGAGNLYLSGSTQVMKAIPDGSPASVLVSGLSSAEGVAVDALGNLYIADSGNNRVLKVPADGSPQTTVGSNLLRPTTVAFDAEGNIYIADNPNSRIVKVPADGSPQTTIGTGLYYPYAVAVDPAGTVYISEGGMGVVLRVGADGNGQDTVVSGIPQLQGIAIDGSANTYFVERGKGIVHKLGRQAQHLSFGPLLAGELSATQTVTIENAGNKPLHFSSIGPGSHVVIDSGATTCSTSVPVPPGAMCQIGVQFRSSTAGTIQDSLELVTDSAGDSSRAITVTGLVSYPPTQLVFTTPPPVFLTGGGSPGNVEVSVTDNDGNLAVAVVTLAVTGPNGYSQTYGPVTATSGVARFDLSSVFLPVPGIYTHTATSTGLTSAVATETVTVRPDFGNVQLGTTNGAQPISIIIRAAGVLSSIDVVTQGATNLDFQFAPGGTCSVGTSYAPGDTCTVNVIFTALKPGLRKGAVLLKDAGGAVFQTTFLQGVGSAPLVAFDPGAPETVFSGLQQPGSIEMDAAGNLFISDRTLEITKLPADGSAPVKMGSDLYALASLAMDGAGILYATDSNNNRVLRVLPDGSAQTVVGSGLTVPRGVAVDAGGNLYIADSWNYRLLEVPADGGPQRTVDLGRSMPNYMATDAGGNLYLSYSPGFGGSQIMKMPPDGSANSILASNLSQAYPISLDPANNVYFADNTNNQIVKIPSGGGALRVVASGLSSPRGLAVDGFANIYLVDYFTNSVLKLNRQDKRLLFGPQIVGEVGPAQTVMVENAGTSPLHFVSIEGDSNTILDDATTTCSVSTAVAPGESCQLGVRFTSSVAGPSIPGSIVLTDDAPNSPQTITLTGYVSYPATKLDFTAPPRVTVLSGTNAGTAEITVHDVENNLATADVTLTVTGPDGYSQTYGPITSVNGVALFDLSQATLSALGTYTYTATSPGLISAEAHQTVVSPSSFGDLAVGENSAVQEVMVVFSSSGTLQDIEAVTQGVPNRDFHLVDGGTCTTGTSYPEGTYCSVNLTFAPLFPGIRKGAVLLKDAAGTVIGKAYVGGIGHGSLVVFNSDALENINSGQQYTAGVDVDAGGNMFIAGSTPALVKVPADGTDPVAFNVNYPRAFSVAIDGAGDAYIAVEDGVLKAPADGSTPVPVGSNLYIPKGLAVDGTGDLYIASGSGVVVVPADGGQQRVALPRQSYGVALDLSGNLYITAQGTNQVEMMPEGGGTSSIVTPLEHYPYGLALDAAGILYIAEAYNGVEIIRLASDGSVLTTSMPIAGTPVGITVDSLGNLYIPDWDSGSTARKINRSVPPQLTFGSVVAGTTSATQTVTIENDGDQPLNFESISPASNAVVDASTTTCSVSTAVPPGGTCQVGLQFTATTAGANLAGSVVLTDDAVTSPQTIRLSGSATPAASSQLYFTLPPLGAVQAGANAGTVRVWARDVYGNPVDTVGNVSLTVSGPGGYSQTYGPADAVDGSISFDVSSAMLSVPGTYSYTATRPETSSASASQVVPDFRISTNRDTITVYDGMNGTATLTITPDTDFARSVSLTCSVPSSLSCTLFSDSVTLNGSAVEATISVRSKVSTAQAGTSGLVWSLGAGLLGLCFAGCRRRKSLAARLGMIAILVLPLMMIAGCGGKSIPPATTSTITVTASAGPLQHTMQLQVVVK